MRGTGNVTAIVQHAPRGAHPARPRATIAATSARLAHRARSTSGAQPGIPAHRPPRARKTLHYNADDTARPLDP
jgi:hypothetical protein